LGAGIPNAILILDVLIAVCNIRFSPAAHLEAQKVFRRCFQELKKIRYSDVPIDENDITTT